MVREDSKILSKGGAILLLLPLFIYSYSIEGVSFAYNLTNNINGFDLSGGGQIASLRPYVLNEDFVTLNYNGDFSLIDFDPTNFYMANNVGLAKKLLLRGVGNKTTLYAGLYSFYAPSYSLYNLVDIIGGDSLNVYLGNFLFSPDARVRYKYFYSDLIRSYYEPRLKAAIRIPLPYTYFTPKFEGGFRIYGEEAVPFYIAEAQLYFPLTIDLSLAVWFAFNEVSYPDTEYITPIQYVDDPFFEEENINEKYELGLYATKAFIKQQAFIETRAHLFRKRFYDMEGMDREDEGVNVSLQYTKFVSSTLVFYVKASTLFNSSTVNDFDFVKNDLELIFELIF
ncbi:MAG: hypothetical protein OEV79_06655 [candidate division WOR-3 bacterium]|nr:hypothetical protein [candidate division WOR-3 bacterium]